MLLTYIALFVSSLAFFTILFYISEVLYSELKPINYKRSLLNQQIAKRAQ